MVRTGLNGIRLRLAHRLDLEAISNIEELSFPDPYPQKLLANLLHENPKTFFVTEAQDGTIIGYCVAVEELTRAHLISIAVLPQYRLQGIGKALIRALISSLDSRVTELRLEVKERNVEAMKLYESLGFRSEEFIEGYYGDGSAALEMRLKLDDR